MLELNAAAIGRKLANEKEARLLCEKEREELKLEVNSLYGDLQKLEQELEDEMERCDELEKIRIDFLNKFETEKLEHNHAIIRLSGTCGQQNKAIDFLQSRIEEIEPKKKKKKKDKEPLYKAPMQYKELNVLLEEEKAANVKLQQKVNEMRSEIHDLSSKVKRLKSSRRSSAAAHVSYKVLSPSSQSAVLDIMKPSLSQPQSKVNKTPTNCKTSHKMNTWLCNKSVKCSVCLNYVRFATVAYKCSESGVVCHAECRSHLTSTGMNHQTKSGSKIVAFSNRFLTNKKGNEIQGQLKVLCGNGSW